MIDFGVSMIMIAIEVISFRVFLSSFCEYNKFRIKKKIYEYLILSGLAVAYYIVSTTCDDKLLLKFLLIISADLIAMSTLFMDRFRKILFLTILFQGLLLTVDYFTYVILYANFINPQNVAQNYIVEGVVIVAIDKLLLFLVVTIIGRLFRKKNTDYISDKEWYKFSIFPIFTLISITYICTAFNEITNKMQAGAIGCISVGMVIMNIFMYYMMNSVINKEIKLREVMAMEMQTKSQMELYSIVLEKNEKQRSIIHEFKNEIFCIGSMLEREEYEELNKYMEEVNKSIHSKISVLDVNNVTVNAILNSKFYEAEKKKILCINKFNDLSELRLEDEDIVVLLCNLMNNAIEACEKCKKRKIIWLKFMIESNNIILSVKNTYEHALNIDSNNLMTTKDRADEHGIGIKNIINIIEKYDGDYSIKITEDKFMFSIIIPNRE